MNKVVVPTTMIVALATVAMAAPAAAQDVEDGPRRTRVGLGVQLVPSYPGSHDVSIRPLFDLARTRGDRPYEFEAPDESFGFPVLRAGKFAFGPAIGFEGERDAADVGANLPDVDFTFEVGGFVQYALSDALRARIEVRKGLGGHDGLIGTVGFDFIQRDGNDWLISVGPRLTLADDNYNGAYFSVAPQDVAASGLPAYTAKGGRMHLATSVEKVETENGRVTGVTAGGRFFAADAVISTVPTPLISKMVPDLPAESKARYNAIRNIGVVCLIFRLTKSISKHFWINIVDDRIEIPGVIEFSNLRPVDDTIVYVPYYMPTTQPKWQWSDQQFIDEAFGYIRKVNPQITQDDLIDVKVGRLKYAQPVCEPDFLDKLPPIQTPIAGLQSADTCYYYPEDRGIAESVRYGRMMAETVVV